MSFETLVVEEQGNVLIITLDRPQSKNAVNSQLWSEMCEALDYFEGTDSLRVAILTNKGNCFCAGADLKEIEAGTYHPPLGRREQGFAGFCGRYCSKPVIAAVNGKALGGGAELVLASDLAVMSDDGLLGLPEVKRGLLAAGGGGLMRLGRSIPLKRAMEIVLTGDPIDAETALDWGLVNRVVPPEQVLDTALQLAQVIAKNSPHSLKISKYALYDCLNKSCLPVADSWHRMLELEEYVRDTPDGLEGVAAFAEKREPDWPIG